MKTQGIQVECGFLVFAAAQCQAVPPQFWARLKFALTKAGQFDAFTQDFQAENQAIRDARTNAQWSTRLSEDNRERALFRLWVERVVGPQTLWPWQRGWAPELVDSYLETPAARAA